MSETTAFVAVSLLSILALYLVILVRVAFVRSRHETENVFAQIRILDNGEDVFVLCGSAEIPASVGVN